MADKTLVLSRPYIPKAETRIKDATEAVEDFASQLAGPALGGVVFFCSPEYDLTVLGAAMKKAFDCPVIGCTSGGEIGLRYQAGSLIGVGLPASYFNLYTPPAIPWKDFARYYDKIYLKFEPRITNPDRFFGLMLADGNSYFKQSAEILRGRDTQLNIIGATNGLSRADKNGYVYSKGQFFKDMAAFALVECHLPFKRFSFKFKNDADATTAELTDGYVEALKHHIGTLREEMPDILFTIGFESHERRRVIDKLNLYNRVQSLMSPLNITGFSTMDEISYGNVQRNTFTGIAFGAG